MLIRLHSILPLWSYSTRKVKRLLAHNDKQIPPFTHTQNHTIRAKSDTRQIPVLTNISLHKNPYRGGADSHVWSESITDNTANVS